MKNKLIYIFILFINYTYAQSVIVDDQRTVDNLIMDVLFGGNGCSSVSNISITGGDFGTGENSYGYFNSNGSNFQFNEGIVLTTGKALDAAGPNNFISSSGDENWGPDIGVGGDSDLELVTGASGTLNATYLEFDIIADSNFISFEYIYASEGYDEFQPITCISSDEFVALIRPFGGSYTNMALVPNTDTRVGSITVRPLVVSAEGNQLCEGRNEAYFDQFNDSTASINYNGQTVVMNAQSEIIVGQPYHIKIIIADDNNPLRDSAIFLNAGSFNFNPAFLGENLLLTNGTGLCPEETYLLDAGNAIDYYWFKDDVPYDGVLLPLIAGQFLIVSEPGIYSVIVGSDDCATEDSIIIEYDTLALVNNTFLTACSDNDFGTFNLNEAEINITNNSSTLFIDGFYLTMSNAINFPNSTKILNPENFSNIVLNQIIIARILSLSGCVFYAEIELRKETYPQIEDDETIFYCLNDFPNTITIESGLLSSNPDEFTFNWLNGEISQNIEINEPGIYTVEITKIDTDCMVSRTITVEPSNVATFLSVLVTDMDNKDRVSMIVDVSGEGDYEYSLDNSNFQDLNAFEFLEYGEHIIYIRDKNGCITDTVETIFILDYPKFFTPNKDGQFDSWNINNINRINSNFNTISKITIFDRYGKTMAIVNPNGNGWDGMFKGKPVPTSDYWFSIELINFRGETIHKKGHFSLLR